MNLLDAVTAPWAITPEAYRTVCAVVNRKLSGEAVDLESVARQVGKPLQNRRVESQLVGDIAVVPILGVLARGMNLIMEISGGTSTQVALGQIRDAIANPNVRAIVLQVNSPGGSVDGTTEIADAVFAGRNFKPIVAFAEGTMASAAYWIGSAASKVFVSEPTTAVGSIGVVATHVDFSGREAQLGVKTTEITAGKYKRIFSAYAPLSAEGRASIQEAVDYQYSLFVDAIARNRGTTVDTVLERMADGKVFYGRQAVDAGLVDGIKSFESVISELSAAGAASNVVPAVSTRGNTSGVAVAPAASSEELAGLGLRLTDQETAFLLSGERPRDPPAIALHARVHQARERVAGRNISASEAVSYIMKEFNLG